MSREHFNQAAATWDQRPLSVQIASAVTAAIQALVPIQPHWEALEYGCGTGLVGLALAPQLKSLLACDNAESMITRLQEKAQAQGLKNVQGCCLDVVHDPLPQARFDLIFSSMTLHHIADTGLLLQRLCALLKPGGYIALADLEAEDGSFHAPHIPSVMHYGFERTHLHALCEAAGLSAITFHPAHVVQRQDEHGQVRHYPIFLLSATLGK
jgi:predicted TPR repeat methyltransferase